MKSNGISWIELTAIGVIIIIGILIMASFSYKPSQEYQMEECMRMYNDFDYCKYKLGVE